VGLEENKYGIQEKNIDFCRDPIQQKGLPLPDGLIESKKITLKKDLALPQCKDTGCLICKVEINKMVTRQFSAL
jgi:hypothetical protein